MQHDEEAPPNEQDQHFEETVYVAAGGGWKTLLIISLILGALGVYLILGDEPNPLGNVVCFAGFIGLVFTWKGVTYVHPNAAVLLTYATKYQGTMK